MKTCLRCGCNTVDEVKFCPECGTPFAPPQEMPPPPPYYGAPPMGGYPPPPPPVKPKPPALAKSIVSMALSISGLECAAVGLFFVTYIGIIFTFVTAVGMSEVAYDSDVQFVKGFFSIYILVIAFILGGIGLAMSLVGRYLGNKAQDEGNQTKMAHFGIKLGKIALILSIVTFALATVSAIFLWII